MTVGQVQRIRSRLRNRSGVFGAGYSFMNAEAETLVAAMSTEPDDTRKGVIDTLVGALKTAGVWAELDVLYLFAAHTSQAALLNWKNPGTLTATAVNTPTFTADRGFTGNGTTSYVNTGYNPTTHGVNYAQDDAGFWLYCLTDAQENVYVGTNANPGVKIRIRDTADRLLCTINDGSNTNTSNGSMTNSVGLISTTRAASGTKKGWRNGSQVGSDLSVASTGVPNDAVFVGALSTGTGFSTRQWAAAALGSACTGLESAFYTAMNAYMVSVGADS